MIAFIEEWGAPAIAAFMFLENIFPPIPSELIMPFAGFAAGRGDLHLALVIAAGTAGSVAGTLPWYWLGRAIGTARLHRWTSRHGRWLTVSPDDISKAERWFEQHGRKSVFFGRLVPAVRSIISAPAGIAGMPMPSFLFWSAAGSLVWTAALATLGYMMESRYEEVAHWLDPVAKVVLGALIVGYLYRVVTFKR